MSIHIKPYRLINQSERDHLQHFFTTLLEQWNHQYAVHPLVCELHSPRQWPDKGIMITDQGKAIALLLDTDLSVIKFCLFEDTSESFNHISETLFKTLLHSLLDTNDLTLHPETPNAQYHDWYYTGSPSLALTLHGRYASITLNIHPQWVLNKLPPLRRNIPVASALSNTIAEQRIPLQVTLQPMNLCLNDIARLKVGDVIKTDHYITSPALLMHQEQSICAAHIGTSDRNKSIQITRSS